ncbi:hypothetical protein INR49_029752 [Caranx melampygus]|nr:hypothetical protein INR49_029752 [Caranx melampygus]
MEDFCSTYFPCHSDTPTPDLDLGWPERGPWVPNPSVTIHTNPPAEGEPHVREIIRRHLQKASQVIAIVTDRLTDGAIIGDLHNAASRGVAIYIIMNQRSIQENFTLSRLRHPNMRVRVVGGKSFSSRTGRMVVGEMKDKFLLVDLGTVIHGSYSLTWMDAHLHRQLITVIRGPIVESFDREFRILFAASLPVPDTGKALGTLHTDVNHHLKDFSGPQFQKQHLLDSEIMNPPPPPVGTLLDWEAMGVVPRQDLDSPPDHQLEMPPKNDKFNKNTPITDRFTKPGNQFLNKIRVEPIVEKSTSRQVSTEKNTYVDDKTKPLGDKTAERTNNLVGLSIAKRREDLTKEPIMEEKSSTEETSSKVVNTPSSRKPIILRVPQSESFSSLSDIMKRIQSQQSTSRLTRKGPNAKSELSRSMMDLSVHNTDSNNEKVPVPRFKHSCVDPGQMTPAVALMKKRSNDQSLFNRNPKNLLPMERPRSSSYGLRMDWRKLLPEQDGDQH